HQHLKNVASRWEDADQADEAAELFETLPRVSVDYAIMEKAVKVAAVELCCEWLDVGSWNSLAEVHRLDAHGNTVAAPQVLTMDCSGNIIAAETDHLIAAIGVHDLVIVHAPDATLICRRED